MTRTFPSAHKAPWLPASKSYKKLSAVLGDVNDKLGNDAKGAVWWWGRGTRWPGWYIIAYLSAGPHAPPPPHCLLMVHLYTAAAAAAAALRVAVIHGLPCRP